jgi:hypothetical protein
VLDVLWSEHRASPFPREYAGRLVGGCDLTLLDADIGACVDYYLNQRRLDPARLAALRQCVDRLERALPQVTGEAHVYFARLEAMAGILLHYCQSGAVPS